MPAHHHGEPLQVKLTKRPEPPGAPSAAARAARLRQAFEDGRVQAQIDMAQRLQLAPAAITTLEYHTDMYLTLLRRCLASLGGTLEVVVQFPDGQVTSRLSGRWRRGACRGISWHTPSTSS